MSVYHPGGSRIMRELVEAATLRQHGNCYYCTMPMTFGDRRAVGDHKIPRWAGGGTTKHNVVAACYHCDKHKGPLPAKVFMALRKNYKALSIARTLVHQMLLGLDAIVKAPPQPNAKQRAMVEYEAVKAAVGIKRGSPICGPSISATQFVPNTPETLQGRPKPDTTRQDEAASPG